MLKSGAISPSIVFFLYKVVLCLQNLDLVNLSFCIHKKTWKNTLHYQIFEQNFKIAWSILQIENRYEVPWLEFLQIIDLYVLQLLITTFLGLNLHSSEIIYKYNKTHFWNIIWKNFNFKGSLHSFIGTNFS